LKVLHIYEHHHYFLYPCLPILSKTLFIYIFEFSLFAISEFLKLTQGYKWPITIALIIRKIIHSSCTSDTWIFLARVYVLSVYVD
ncbi:hypothetical protein ACJX0J_013381, partial [Zea mays]